MRQMTGIMVGHRRAEVILRTRALSPFDRANRRDVIAGRLCCCATSRELRSVTRAETSRACDAIAGSSFSHSPYCAMTAAHPEAADRMDVAPVAANSAMLILANC